MEIYEAVKAIIVSSDRTLIEWAEISNLTKSQLSRFANGKTDLRVRTLERLINNMSLEQKREFFRMVLGDEVID